MTDEFTCNGYYYSDLSPDAQHQFLDTMSLGYGEFGEESTDADVLQSFLSVNFRGHPMSKQHIDYVKSIADKFTEKQ